MFVRIELQNRLLPAWKSIHYINLSNILHLEMENTQVKIYTVTRPKYAAKTLCFPTKEYAEDFVEQCFQKMHSTTIVTEISSISKRLPPNTQEWGQQPNPDRLALDAIDDWEEEKEEEKQLQ